MLENLKIKFFSQGDCTCLVIQGDKVVFMSADRGIKPLLCAQKLLYNSCVADKIIGKAAAMICANGGVRAVYGDVMSESAKTVLEENGILFDFGTLTPNIKNRQGDGICPMESLVLQINDPKEGFEILSNTIKRMS